MDNDANLAALGEHRYGAGRAVMICFISRSVLGWGAVSSWEERFIGGHFEVAGEFGHMIIDRNGPLCSCKNRGCLEALSSGTAIKRDAQELVNAGQGSHMLSLAGTVEKVDAGIVGLAALGGDAEAQAILSGAGRNLGIAIASVMNLLNPEIFIIGGGVVDGVGDLILNPARDEAYKNTYPPYRKFLKIVPAGLLSDSGFWGLLPLLGAISQLAT